MSKQNRILFSSLRNSFFMSPDAPQSGAVPFIAVTHRAASEEPLHTGCWADRQQVSTAAVFLVVAVRVYRVEDLLTFHGCTKSREYGMRQKQTWSIRSN